MDEMEQVPDMISTKDLAYLSDIFGWNFTASKKASHFAKEVTDAEIQESLTQVANMHKSICENIVKILE